jgi:hypothetical protein
MAKHDKKAEKKADKKAVKTAKTEAKLKASKKAVDFKQPVPATIPSAKHDPPISSKAILARVCIVFSDMSRLFLLYLFLIYVYVGPTRDWDKREEGWRVI